MFFDNIDKGPGGTINKRSIFVLLLLATTLSVAFNNCGGFLPQARLGGQVSSSSDEVPWPNSSTSFEESNLISSKIVYNDIDGDFKQEAVFFSGELKKSAFKQIVRVVRSGDFTEMVNLLEIATPADPSVGLLLTDIDLNNGSKELLYVSQDRKYIVGLVLIPPGNGVERFRLQLPNPLPRGQLFNLFEKTEGSDKVIAIGNNLLRINKLTGIKVESAFDRVNGGWSGFSDWGTRCSKSCGDGVLSQIRVCNSPEPRNGGSYCSGNAVRTQVCRVRTCELADCAVTEMLVNGSCIPDPTIEPDVGTPGGGGGGGGGGSGPTLTCPQGYVLFEAFRQCYIPHAFSDIWLTHSIRYGGGREDPPTIEHYTLRLSLTHAKARGLNAKETADRYCYYKGFDGSVSHTTATYRVGTNNQTARAFVTCDIVTNGMHYPRGGCPIGNDRGIGYTMDNIFHQNGEQVRYLKGVVCRNNDEVVSPNRSQSSVN